MATMATSRHLSVDARLAGPRHAGIGRYTAEILTRLMKHSELSDGSTRYPLNWHLWLDASDDAKWLPSKLGKNIFLHRTKVRHYSLAEQTVWPGQIKTVPSDLIWIPHFNVPLNCPFPWVVTIHDLLWHQQRLPSATTLPAWQHMVKHWGYRIVSAHAIKKAEKVLVPTNVVAEDIKTRFGSHINVEVTSEGITQRYLEANLAKRDISSPKILIIGSAYPHKNIEVVLRALKYLPEFTLEIASARSVFSDRVMRQAESLQVAQRVKFLGYVPDSDIMTKSGEYVALVQPSLSEGFGLTGLEGMALGIPVVSSDLPIFEEVYKNFSWKFPPHDEHSLSEILLTLWQTPPEAGMLRAAQRHARTFTWDAAADKTWDAIETAWKELYGK